MLHPRLVPPNLHGLNFRLYSTEQDRDLYARVGFAQSPSQCALHLISLALVLQPVSAMERISQLNPPAVVILAKADQDGLDLASVFLFSTLIEGKVDPI